MQKKYSATDGQGADNPRYEIKMAAQSLLYHDVLAALRVDPEGIRTLFPARTVQSLYLDTPDNRALEDNLAGISRREKLRLRWYGPEARGVAGRLENKIRNDSLGWKEVFPISELDIEGTDRHGFMRDLRRALPAESQHLLLGAVAPVQWISYQRDYLATHDQAIRITLDRKLRAWDQRCRFRLTKRFGTRLPRVLIVEVKCARDHFPRAQALVGRMPMMVGRCSKFVMASSPGEGPMLTPHY